jgi:hypothetical protein
MNLRIKLKSNTNVEWFHERLLDTYPLLNDRGVIYETPAGGGISVLISVDDEEVQLFTRRVILISPQVISVQRA